VGRVAGRGGRERTEAHRKKGSILIELHWQIFVAASFVRRWAGGGGCDVGCVEGCDEEVGVGERKCTEQCASWSFRD
jgi:hypothetical protein